jgi:asparagine synthase (glutamine-hydrolysing)
MCALAGAIALVSGCVIEPDVLRRMAGTMRHRGPDDFGLWLADDRRVGLAHRRLAIIDLDRRANQPMQDGSGRIWVSFNGEIYNHAALRRELEFAGRTFQTAHADTEVLVHGYAEWGLEPLLQRLEGMFAFALYDADRDSLMLVRDRLGVKPLYFTEHRGQLAFASEIKALLQLPDFVRRLDSAAIAHYLTFMATPAPLTPFEGIAKLPAGHLIVVGPDRTPRAGRWWDPCDYAPASSGAPDTQAAAAEVARRLDASVAKRVVADVPVGVFLSGGVDSGSLLALMSRHDRSAVKSFTVGFEDAPDLNEIDEARAQARHFGVDHHEVMIGEADALAHLDDIVHHLDDPIADWVCVPLYFLAKLARDSGTKVVMAGEGADELFCGYASYTKWLAFARRMERLQHIVPGGFAASLVRQSARLMPPSRMGLLGLMDHLDRGLGDREVFWSGAVGLWPLQKRALLPGYPLTSRQPWGAYGLRATEDTGEDSYAIVREIQARARRAAPDDGLARLRLAELALRLPELLLGRIDKMTMAHGVEVREPFLDHHLVEFALGLNQQTLIPGGRTKAVLKQAVAPLLPADVLARPKRGFAAPAAAWLRGEFGRAAEARLQVSYLPERIGLDRNAVSALFAAHREGRRDLSLQLWPIVILLTWYDHWFESRAA